VKLPKVGTSWNSRFEEGISGMGARYFECDAEEHDRQRYVDEQVYKRQVAIRASVFLFLHLAGLIVRLALS
jgi:hypothetical protein